MHLFGARRRIVLTLLDQSVYSVSNFVTGLAIARFSGAAAFGQYMLVLMVWFVVIGLNRALITEPLIVRLAHADDEDVVQRQGVSAELILGLVVAGIVGAIGVVVAVIGAEEGSLMLALSPWFAPLILQDYWRAMAFKNRQPQLALVNDTVFALVQFIAIGLFWALDWRSAGHIIGAWGLGATAGAVLGWVTGERIGRPVGGLILVRKLWPMSRWIAADFLSGFASNQAYLVCAALMLTRTDYGGFRAALNLMGPIVIILHAGTNVGLPEASRRADPDDPSNLHRFARTLSIGVSGGVALYGSIVALFGRDLLRMLYGREFGRFGLLTTLAAVSALLPSFVFGQGIALKALGRMRRVWLMRLIVTAASLGSMYILVHAFGTVGAGWAGVATGCYYAIGVYTVYRVELTRPTCESEPLSAARAETRSSLPAISSDEVP